MYRFFHTTPQLHHYVRTTIRALGFLINPQNIHLRSISTTPSSTTLDFLVDSCGLDPKVALISSQKLTLKTTENPDLVLDVLRKYGITNTQIKQIVSRTPKILTCDPEKTLEPKIGFLHSLGISGEGIVEVLNGDRFFLRQSLENTLVPGVKVLKRYVGSHEELLHALKNSGRYFSLRYESLVGQNSATLRDYGVKERNILKILIYFPSTLLVKNNRFKEIVKKVKEMGFDPSSSLFGYAVRTMAGLSESRWKGKWEAYRKLGFSDEEIITVFKKQPYCLMSSEEKIRKCVDFFTQKLKWNLADICVCPILLRLSLENRLIPRCTVLELLNSKGVIQKKLDVKSIAAVFILSEDDFLKKFVIKYQKAVPEVVNAYKGRIDLANTQEDDGLKELK